MDKLFRQSVYFLTELMIASLNNQRKSYYAVTVLFTECVRFFSKRSLEGWRTGLVADNNPYPAPACFLRMKSRPNSLILSFQLAVEVWLSIAVSTKREKWREKGASLTVRCFSCQSSVYNHVKEDSFGKTRSDRLKIRYYRWMLMISPVSRPFIPHLYILCSQWCLMVRK